MICLTSLLILENVEIGQSNNVCQMIYCFTPGFLPQFYPSFGFLPQFYPNLPSDFVSFHRISSFFQGIFSNTNLSKSTVFRDFYLKNWASGIRTHECRSQSPVPYRLAMGHHERPKSASPGYYNIDRREFQRFLLDFHLGLPSTP